MNRTVLHMTEHQELNLTGIDFCPSCHKVSLTLPKLSRLDNKTQICSLCSHTESMMDFKYLFDATSKNKMLERLSLVNSDIKKSMDENSLKFRYLKMLKSLILTNLKH